MMVFMKEKVRIEKEKIEKMMENSRVNREHDNPNSRNVELKNAIIPDFSSYDTVDTVFIGYPIWWRFWMILLRKMILLEKL